MVASREIEDVLFTAPAIAEGAMIAFPDPLWIEAVAAVVVLRDDAEATEQVLIDDARSSLAGFRLPKRVCVANSPPKMMAGKLLKQELRKQYAGQAGQSFG